MQINNEHATSSDTSTQQPLATNNSTFLKPQSPGKLSPASQPVVTKFTATREEQPSPRPGKRQRLNPQPMTAATAMLEARRESRDKMTGSNATSPNPASQALSALKGTTNTSAEQLSSARENLAASNRVSDPMAVVTQNIQQTPSDNVQVDGGAQTSPVSLSSLGTIESTTAVAGIPQTGVSSPTPIDAPHEDETGKGNGSSTSPDDGNKAFSYPGFRLQPQLDDSRRGMSLPHSGLRQESSRSPSNKKHRCPYCATEFTRHHNLKSHLLTHSQEKPYVCSTCQSRFRRLHDLKRHTKLHTGERPHICEKCGRKFARGDALARHNKGPGGCAGRRASLGSFDGDDYDGNEDSMEGLVYGEPDTMDDEEGPERRLGMPRVPSIKRHAAPADPSQVSPSGQAEYANRQPSTYPPIQGRPAGGITGGLFPQHPSPGGSASSGAGISQGGQMSYSSIGGPSSGLHPPGQGSAVFPQSAMTESPKPLSPGSTPQRQAGQQESSYHRNRSSSVAQKFQQQQFGRTPAGRTPPQPTSMSLPGPPGPQLPPPPGLNPPDSRFTLPSQGGPTHPPTQPSGPPTHMGGSGPLSSHSNSHSSHGASAQGSGEHAGARDDRIWAYIKSLESRVNGLQDEVTTLRGQLALATQPQGR